MVAEKVHEVCDSFDRAEPDDGPYQIALDSAQYQPAFHASKEVVNLEVQPSTAKEPGSDGEAVVQRETLECEDQIDPSTFRYWVQW